MSFSHFKVKDQNIFRLALIDTGNLVHSAIGGKMSKSMDYKVGTADGQSDRLQVLDIGDPWPINLEAMEECNNPRTISVQRTESQSTSRNILLNEAQSEDQLHGGGSCTNACKRWVSIESPVGRQKI